jgi:hypothetical protein
VKVRILKATAGSWYADHIGETFEVNPILRGYIVSADKAPEYRCIDDKDCEVIEQ